MAPKPPELRGLRILVVEDNFLVSEAVAARRRECGCEVVGPAPRLQVALELAAANELDGALLDINLSGETCYPVAAVLQERHIPFLFLTGYDRDAIPAAFEGVPR